MKNRIVAFMDFLEKLTTLWDKTAVVLQKVILVLAIPLWGYILFETPLSVFGDFMDSYAISMLTVVIFKKPKGCWGWLLLFNLSNAINFFYYYLFQVVTYT